MPSMLVWLALAGLLLVPGPTNTLLVVGGATRGFLRAWIFSLAELGAYVLSISVLSLLVGPVLASTPALHWAVRIAAGLYLCHLAHRLWTYQANQVANAPVVGVRHVFVTTLLNPKGLIIAFTMVPLGQLPSFLGVFALTVLPIASFWIATGALLGRSAASGGVAPRWFHRGSAVVLGCFAALLVLLPALRP